MQGCDGGRPLSQAEQPLRGLIDDCILRSAFQSIQNGWANPGQLMAHADSGRARCPGSTVNAAVGDHPTVAKHWLASNSRGFTGAVCKLLEAFCDGDAAALRLPL